MTTLAQTCRTNRSSEVRKPGAPLEGVRPGLRWGMVGYRVICPENRSTTVSWLVT